MFNGEAGEFGGGAGGEAGGVVFVGFLLEVGDDAGEDTAALVAFHVDAAVAVSRGKFLALRHRGFCVL